MPLDEETVTAPTPCSQKSKKLPLRNPVPSGENTLTDLSKYSFGSDFSIVTVAEPFTVS